jgi:cell division protein FtsW (lipid II flippase)
MSTVATATIAASALILAALLALQARKTGAWRAFSFELAALAGFAVFLNLLFPWRAGLSAKGGRGERFALAGFLGLCMIFGMLAQFLYRHFERPHAERPQFDWGMFIAPLFASPIVFIPLLAALDVDHADLGNMTATRSMIFFVAFQNGFFWKEFFDRKQRQEGSPRP